MFHFFPLSSFCCFVFGYFTSFLASFLFQIFRMEVLRTTKHTHTHTHTAPEWKFKNGWILCFLKWFANVSRNRVTLNLYFPCFILYIFDKINSRPIKCEEAYDACEMEWMWNVSNANIVTPMTRFVESTRNANDNREKWHRLKN